MPDAPETAKRKTMSYEDFLTDYPGEYAEWVNGEAIDASTPSIERQALSIWLAKMLDEFVTLRDLGMVLAAPTQMKTGPNLPGRQPDILFVAKEHMDRLKRNHLEGPADLVMSQHGPTYRECMDELELAAKAGEPNDFAFRIRSLPFE